MWIATSPSTSDIANLVATEFSPSSGQHSVMIPVQPVCQAPPYLLILAIINTVDGMNKAQGD